MLGVECCGRMATFLLTETASSMTPLPRQWGWVGGWVDIDPPFTSFHLPSLSNPPAAGNEFSSLCLQTSLKMWSFGHVSILLSLMKLLVYLRTTDIRWPAESRWSTEAWNCLLWTPATFGWQEPQEPQYDRQVCARVCFFDTFSMRSLREFAFVSKVGPLCRCLRRAKFTQGLR